MVNDSNPLLYQVNTRVCLEALSRHSGGPCTLDDIPDAHLDEVAKLGFDWVYLLGVWQTGAAGREVSRSQRDLRHEFETVLTDLKEEDICGSCFAVTSYTVSDTLGGNDSLDRLRARLHQRNLRLMLDFVPNHTARDHVWVEQHPDFYVQGTEADLEQQPHNYVRLDLPRGSQILAHGRDPYFPGWTDTLQLNYANPALEEAMLGELSQVADMCDGVRCDMAMLILPEVFERTWGTAASPFWPEATLKVREQHPSFTFMAEVYWDLEWQLQQQGFDYTYDKRLYDRLHAGEARPVRQHFLADSDYQHRSVRFLENHDEPRAASTFPPSVHQAAAVVTFFCPGMRFFHQGQLQGWQARIPTHLCRGPQEQDNPTLREFYHALLTCLRLPTVHNGDWQLVDCAPAWEGNWTWDCMIAFAWQGKDGQQLLITVNYAPNRSQCYVHLPFPDLSGRTVQLQDLMGPASYERNGDDLHAQGLYLDLPGWGHHVFELVRKHER